MRGRGRTFNVDIIHCCHLRLSLPSNEANAIRLPTITRLCIMTISIDVIVESQFFILLDIAFGEDAHSYPLAHDPFGDVAVRVAAVVREPADAAAFRRIDELHKCTSRKQNEVRSAKVRRCAGAHADVRSAWTGDAI